MIIKVISLFLNSKSIVDVSFDYFEAIDNKNKKSKFIFNSRVFKLIYGREPKNGEIGCSLSHFEVINDFYKTPKINDNTLIVLEDDAVLESDFKKGIEEIEKLLSIDKPSIFILGFSKTKKENNFIHRLKWPLKHCIMVNDRKFGFSNINHCGTVGYMLNKSAAKVISEQENIFWLADDWNIISNMGVDVYVPDKPYVYEDLDTPSSINNKICCYNSLRTNFKRNFILILKGLFSRL